MITDYMGGEGEGGGVYRDPKKWLRNIWMTPNSEKWNTRGPFFPFAWDSLNPFVF